MSVDQGQNPFASNPYAARSNTLEPMSPQLDGANETIRRTHLNHEASLQSFGTLLMFGGVLLIIVGPILFAAGLTGATDPELGDASDSSTSILSGLFCLLFGGLQFVIARGLWKLNSVGKIGGTLFGAIGLIGFPIGTLINGYFLYLIWSKKGQFVFSPEYRVIIDSTPHIKYKTSIIVKIFAIMLAILIAVGVIAAFVMPLFA